MAQDLKYLAIVLGKHDVGEVDRLYSLYTREAGKVRLLAKGARKSVAKLAGNLETLNLVEVYVAKGRGQGKITGVIALESFSFIRGDIFALESVFEIFRLIGRMISEEEKDENTFELILAYLKALEEFSSKGSLDLEKVRLVKFGFIFKLLDNLGYQVQVGRCLLCGKTLESQKNYFAIQKGGVICEHCAGREPGKIPISQNVIKIIRIFLSNKLENLGKVKVSEKDLGNLENIVKNFLKWTD